ncbi:MAG: acyl-CoA desaturase [Nocardiopsaceae bacterium]|nr:acyl-CoA desaturase [Nocardiopsaceae bacterium]
MTDPLRVPTGTEAPAGQAGRSEFDPKPKGIGKRFAVAVSVAVPLLTLLGAIPLAWGWGLGWHDIVLGVVFYTVSCLGVTVGFHRHFTHRSFKATRPVRLVLAVAGSLALQGDILSWVATHRKHHKYSDREGDPHSPWRFGSDWRALTKGMIYAHMGWVFERSVPSQQRFCPDLLADRGLRRVSLAFPALTAASILLPPLIGGLWSMSWAGMLTAFVWAGLVRIGLLQHVTWSINSICHTFGDETFEVRDKSRNVAWLALLSFGESWHNLHHADPTCARHGVLKGQVDVSARLIWILEKLGLVYDVRWPDPARLAPRQTGAIGRGFVPMTK